MANEQEIRYNDIEKSLIEKADEIRQCNCNGDIYCKNCDEAQLDISYLNGRGFERERVNKIIDKRLSRFKWNSYSDKKKELIDLKLEINK